MRSDAILFGGSGRICSGFAGWLASTRPPSGDALPQDIGLGVPGDDRSNMDDTTKPPQDRLWQPTTAKWLFVVFGATLAYAILRITSQAGCRGAIFRCSL